MDGQLVCTDCRKKAIAETHSALIHLGITPLDER